MAVKTLEGGRILRLYGPKGYDGALGEGDDPLFSLLPGATHAPSRALVQPTLKGQPPATLTCDLILCRRSHRTRLPLALVVLLHLNCTRGRRLRLEQDRLSLRSTLTPRLMACKLRKAA